MALINGGVLIDSGVLLQIEVPPPNPSMVMVVNTTLNGDSPPYGARTIRLPVCGTYNCTIDWGDGITESVSGDRPQPGFGNYETHTYATDGVYTITISGTMTAFGDYYSIQNCLIEVVSWGTTGLTGMLGGLYGAASLTTIPLDPPPTTITDMGYMFGGCTIFNQNISNWNVSNVTNMAWMFSNCIIFNQNLSGWNVSNVVAYDNYRSGATAWESQNWPPFPNP